MSDGKPWPWRELLSLEADPRSPERGQYSFVQALIREVAYNTLARRDRKTRHLSAARYYESPLAAARAVAMWCTAVSPMASRSNSRAAR